MNKKIILALLAVTMLFIAGCGEGGSDTRQSGFSTDAFHGGERALKAEFDSGAPPERVRDGSAQTFSVRVLLENMGEYDIEEGEAHVSISGISSRDFNLDESAQALNSIRGVNKQGSGAIIDGGRSQITFQGLNYEPELSSPSFEQDLIANICYPYKTTAVTSLCIAGDTFVTYDEDTSVCDLQSQRAHGSSGSPLKIENVEQYPATSTSIEFQFDIVHTPTEDNGRLFESGSMDSQCRVNGNSPTSSDASLQRDRVQYEVDTSPLEGLNCNNEGRSGEVQLSDYRATVFCTLDTTGEEEYVKPISIELSYDYLERISKTLTIERSSR